MAIVYQHDRDGYYLGETDDYGGPLPHNCVAAAPTLRPGLIPRWNGHEWKQEQNHVGEKGYVNGESVEIRDYGPLPEGFTSEWIDPRTPAEIRRDDIERRLLDIDRESVRPLRAIIDAQDKIAALEAEAAAIQAESEPDQERLAQIEVESTGAWSASEYDRNKLAALDAEARDLRQELAALTAAAPELEGATNG